MYYIIDDVLHFRYNPPKFSAKMTKAYNFEVFRFNRAAKEETQFATSTDIDDSESVDLREVARVLRLLFPHSAGVRITIL